MRKYTYLIFPIWIVVSCYISLFSSVFFLILTLGTGAYDTATITYMLPIIIVSLIVVSFRRIFVIDTDVREVWKQSKMLGCHVTNKKIKIPVHCKGIYTKRKSKAGKAYYRAAVGMSYYMDACDMYFLTDKGRLVRLINTDYKQAIKIAKFFKSSLDMEHFINSSS